MADIETLLNQLSELTQYTNLTIGNSSKLKSEITRLTQINQGLCNIYTGLEKALNDEQFNKGFLSFLPWVGTVASFLIPGGFLAEALISGGGVMLADKLIDPEKETSLADLVEHTGGLIEWVNLLTEIAQELLNNSEFLNIVSHREDSINKQFNQLEKSLRLNLDFDNLTQLKIQIEDIKQSQIQLRKVQNILDQIIDNIEKNVEVIEDRIKILVIYFGRSEFALEWIDDDEGLIISYDRDQFISIHRIFNNCMDIRDKLEQLESKANNFRIQGEQLLQEKSKSKKVSQKQDHYLINQQNYSVQLSQSTPSKNEKNIFKILFIGSTLATCGYFSYLNIDKINTVIPILNYVPFLNQDSNNLEKAENLAMEASLIVQNPPHPFTVWQQSQQKWQEAINLLEKISNNSSLFLKTQEKLTNYRQNHQVITQRIKTEQKALADFENAQNLALEATMLTQNPPHNLTIWKQSQTKWQQAINLLKGIPKGTFVEKQAKEKLKSYQLNYQVITNHINKY